MVLLRGQKHAGLKLTVSYEALRPYETESLVVFHYCFLLCLPPFCICRVARTCCRKVREERAQLMNLLKMSKLQSQPLSMSGAACAVGTREQHVAQRALPCPPFFVVSAKRVTDQGLGTQAFVFYPCPSRLTE